MSRRAQSTDDLRERRRNARARLRDGRQRRGRHPLPDHLQEADQPEGAEGNEAAGQTGEDRCRGAGGSGRCHRARRGERDAQGPKANRARKANRAGRATGAAPRGTYNKTDRNSGRKKANSPEHPSRSRKSGPSRSQGTATGRKTAAIVSDGRADLHRDKRRRSRSSPKPATSKKIGESEPAKPLEVGTAARRRTPTPGHEAAFSGPYEGRRSLPQTRAALLALHGARQQRRLPQAAKRNRPATSPAPSPTRIGSPPGRRTGWA